MRLQQLPSAAAALPRTASWAPMAWAGGVGLVVIGLGGADQGPVVFKLRLAGASVAAASAWLFDDPAAATLASSPTPLLARRGIRVAAAGAFVAVWWAVAAVIVTGRVHPVPLPALTSEVAALTTLAVVGAVGSQRWSSDARGGSAGAMVAICWFALSFMPPMGGVPLPPQPLQPGAAGPLLVVAGAAFGLALLLSRDPAARRPTMASSGRSVGGVNRRSEGLGPS